MASPELRLGLFARTFLLLALLMLASLAAWLHVFLTLERAPRAAQIADQVVRTVQMTEVMHQFIDPHQLPQLLTAIDGNTDLMLIDKGQAQTLVALPNNPDWRTVTAMVQARLGSSVELASSSPSVPDLWVGLPAGQWLGMRIQKTSASTAPEWVSWIAAAVLLSMVGAAIAVGYLNRPLARLARAAQQLSQGQAPVPLPETGPQEIQELNASFNRMVNELQQSEADRNLMLAGISHDLRTPLARMRLEVEMSPMSEQQRRAIDDDLSQIDQTIGQLLQYAKPASDPPTKPIDLLEVTQDVIDHIRPHLSEDSIQLRARTSAFCLIAREDYSRCLTNLLENARRYGTSVGTLTIEVVIQSRGSRLHVDVRDQGPGIAANEVSRLLRPFSRGDTARTGGAGAGLGLAIVQRLLLHAGGRLRLLPRQTGGLIARMDLPRAKRQGRHQKTSSSSSTNSSTNINTRGL